MSEVVVYLHDTRGRLARVAWVPTAERAKATVDESEPDHVQARVVWPDGSWRVLSRSAVGGPWTPGPRVSPASSVMRESA